MRFPNTKQRNYEKPILVLSLKHSIIHQKGHLHPLDCSNNLPTPLFPLPSPKESHTFANKSYFDSVKANKEGYILHNPIYCTIYLPKILLFYHFPPRNQHYCKLEKLPCQSPSTNPPLINHQLGCYCLVEVVVNMAMQLA